MGKVKENNNNRRENNANISAANLYQYSLDMVQFKQLLEKLTSMELADMKTKIIDLANFFAKNDNHLRMEFSLGNYELLLDNLYKAYQRVKALTEKFNNRLAAIEPFNQNLIKILEAIWKLFREQLERDKESQHMEFKATLSAYFDNKDASVEDYIECFKCRIVNLSVMKGNIDKTNELKKNANILQVSFINSNWLDQPPLIVNHILKNLAGEGFDDIQNLFMSKYNIIERIFTIQYPNNFDPSKLNTIDELISKLLTRLSDDWVESLCAKLDEYVYRSRMRQFIRLRQLFPKATMHPRLRQYIKQQLPEQREFHAPCLSSVQTEYPFSSSELEKQSNYRKDFPCNKRTLQQERQIVKEMTRSYVIKNTYLCAGSKTANASEEDFRMLNFHISGITSNIQLMYFLAEYGGYDGIGNIGMEIFLPLHHAKDICPSLSLDHSYNRIYASDERSIIVECFQTITDVLTADQSTPPNKNPLYSYYVQRKYFIDGEDNTSIRYEDLKCSLQIYDKERFKTIYQNKGIFDNVIASFEASKKSSLEQLQRAFRLFKPLTRWKSPTTNSNDLDLVIVPPRGY
ncbi:MAG: hypothetical protein Tsb005_13950 [Gammaproteobacteria bacterium]